MNQLDRLKSDVDSLAIRIHIAEHGVVSCPPGVALGMTWVEKATGISGGPPASARTVLARKRAVRKARLRNAIGRIRKT